ncbi:hypothetical protein ONZ45_g1995 [Pleurotus djamor]|nr:hypothetical protein ONZ45_g1995 [Pleurotus djamor]
MRRFWEQVRSRVDGYARDVGLRFGIEEDARRFQHDAVTSLRPPGFDDVHLPIPIPMIAFVPSWPSTAELQKRDEIPIAGTNSRNMAILSLSSFSIHIPIVYDPPLPCFLCLAPLLQDGRQSTRVFALPHIRIPQTMTYEDGNVIPIVFLAFSPSISSTEHRALALLCSSAPK